MKKLFILAVTALFATSIAAQSNAIDKYFSEYTKNENFTKINVTGKMFQLANHIEVDTDEEQEMKDAISKIEGLSVLACDDCGDTRALYKELENRPGREFEVLMTVDDKEADVIFYIHENGGVIKEILIIAGGDEGLAIVSIWGEIELQHLQTVTKEFQLHGMKYFNEELVEASAKVKCYPNPVLKGTSINLEIPSELQGATIKIHDINGKLVQEIESATSNMEVQTSSLKKGNYILSLTKDKVQIYNKTVIVQ